ncbi:MAG TPA: DNA polymerase III subunit alpha [Pyrinomonadaceae bacterium]|mgnify:CR=1 FL=1|nr:DNA polymerase III subunit alpha [Chloracidobacterium sp.]MBL0239363.1 DNA polymerase III subunit alpha [Chloracidobacterium sp.]MBP9936423.1 DNA polymerase III subunit alpha [Pyrinomonadaceae bacterium]HQY67890.1 DNA polymerase III subunit alpha [Pyrinomonadaceae bacterium]HRA40576.1 DNA polymerase III subunit alpha [Pyrinomonadaceae bacterium]
MPNETKFKPFSAKDFVHLHLHSDYSLLQSTIQLKPLANRLEELDLKACALTDYGNMYGAVTFFNTMAGIGIKPIIGYEAYVTSGSRHERSSALAPGEKPFYRLVLLAKDLAGYRNLAMLASKAFTEGFLHRPRIDFELLAENSEGLIGLSSGPEEIVGHYLNTGNDKRALEVAKSLEEILGKDRFYLEIQDHCEPHFIAATRKIIEFSKTADLPIVATNDVQYLNREDARAQQALIALADGRTLGENSRTSPETSLRYLRSAEEMWDIFGGELPESLTNTVKIAEMIEFEMPQGDEHRQLPKYPIPPEYTSMDEDEYFVKVLNDGFDERKRSEWDPLLANGRLKHSITEYRERLAIEIATIKKMGFPGYFLIVWDFIRYAREKGIPVGPGRGSAAGSLAAYCLRITDVDPLQHELLFERFLNPERVSMPDIDIDFCIRGRGEVIDHVTQLYGRESVCQIVTFGTMASRAAIKDVGRVLNMPYGDVERIAKMIPPPVRGRNVSISQALKEVPELSAAMNADPRVNDLVELALRIEGCARHTSVHAAGVVISPRPLQELVPVAMSKDELTSQYPMNDLEKVGMLKMDFLGLTTLTVIADCLASIKARLGETIDWTSIPNNEEKTMQLFGEGRTEAIFQFESSGMADMCRRLKPKELEDLSALNALYRPGPLDGGMIDDFIDRHRGVKPVEYIVPEMEDILGNTFGVLVYQEQIMQLAQKLAGYSLGEADLMRRAMGKKKVEEMLTHETKFVSGAVERGIERKTAKEIFDLMSKFADYGFNRSHSMAYAVLAFQTAYLKAHYPPHFYASVLSHEAQDSAKVYKYSTELRSLGLQLLPPDINESDEGFTPGDGAVRYGLTAIKGMGSASVQAIVEARKNTKFTSLHDFCSRLGAGAVNRRGLESLVAAGAFDTLMPETSFAGEWRARLTAAIDGALQHGQRAATDRERGQSGLFGAVDADDVASEEAIPFATPWSQTEISQHEKASIGFYLSVHPLDNYAGMLNGLNLHNFNDLTELNSGDMVLVAGIISGLQVRTSKKGNRFCLFRVEDRAGGIKTIAWSEAFQSFATFLRDDEMVIVGGKIEAGEGQEPTLIVSEVRSLDDSVAAASRSINITLPARHLDQEFVEDIFVTLGSHHGRCEVYLTISADDALVKVLAPGTRVAGSRLLQRELESKGCRVDWAH